MLLRKTKNGHKNGKLGTCMQTDPCYSPEGVFFTLSIYSGAVNNDDRGDWIIKVRTWGCEVVLPLGLEDRCMVEEARSFCCSRFQGLGSDDNSLHVVAYLYSKTFQLWYIMTCLGVLDR